MTPTWYQNPPQAPGAHDDTIGSGASAFSAGASHARDAQHAIQHIMSTGMKDWQGQARDEAMTRLEELAKYVGDLADQWETVSHTMSTLAAGLGNAGAEWNRSERTYAPYSLESCPPDAGPNSSFYGLADDGTVWRGHVLTKSCPPSQHLPSGLPPAPPNTEWTEVLDGIVAYSGRAGFANSGPDALKAQQIAAHAFESIDTGHSAISELSGFHPGGKLNIGQHPTNASRIPWNGGVVIEPGDNLWDISATLTGSGAGYDAIYKHNKGVIGDDPNEIKPGEVLSLTPAEAAKLDKVGTVNPNAYLNSLPAEPMPNDSGHGHGPATHKPPPHAPQQRGPGGTTAPPRTAQGKPIPQ